MKQPIKQPKGPKGPYWWQHLQMRFNFVNYTEAAQKRYGDIFTTRMLHHDITTVFASHPEAIKQLVTTYAKQLRSAGELSNFNIPIMGEKSLFILNDEDHRRHRQLIMPAFHGERVKVYGRLICEITKKVMDEQPVNQTFLARTAAHDITLNIMMKAVFGWHDEEQGDQFQQILRLLQTDFRVLLIALAFFFPSLQLDLGKWSPWGYFLYRKQQLDELIYTEIRKRRKRFDPEREDILTVLMLARDEDGQPLSDRELRDELMTLLIAGDETTGGAIAWSLDLVHRHPEVRNKLLEELDSLGKSPEPMSIFQLPYLSAVCKETLRLYGPEAFTKGNIVISPFELMGYQLNPGTAVYSCLYLLHRREDIYPEPNKFRPERFLEREYSPFEFMPFGMSSRRCIGAGLAELEMRLVLATILLNYELKLADSGPPRPFPPGSTLAPAVKMIMQGKRKRQESSLIVTNQ